MKILVTKRADDYHACIAGHTDLWDCGKSPQSAIGNLVWTHKDKFDLEIEFQTW
jgi:hypothetical protein